MREVVELLPGCDPLLLIYTPPSGVRSACHLTQPDVETKGALSGTPVEALCRVS